MIAFVRRMLIFMALVVAVAPARAEELLDHLPDQAMGFALVRNLGDANARIERVIAIFQELSPEPLTGPLPLLKAATGLGAGVNEQGDAMMVLLASDNVAEPRPLLMTAISDYAAFAGSVNGDASGKICRVVIAGEEVLVAKRGAYAALMNVEHREQLQTLLASPAKRPVALAPLDEWLASTNFAAVLLPVGVDMLATAGKKELDAEQEALGNIVDPDGAETLRLGMEVLTIYQEVLGFLDAEVQALGVGLSIDDAVNVRLTNRVVFAQDGEIAQTKPVAPAKDSPFAGFSNQMFIAAGGGPIPAEWLEAVSGASRRFRKRFPELDGFKNFNEDDWKDVEEATKASLEGLESASAIILAGEADDPVISNLYSILRVKDAKANLDAYRESTKKWNELIKRSDSDIKLVATIEDAEVAGKPALRWEMDVAAAVNDPNVAMMKPMMESLVGKNGKLRGYRVAADARQIVDGVGDEEQIAAIVQQVLEGERGLEQSELVQQATKFLDAKAPWLGLVSPQGCVAWVKRVVNKMLGGAMPPIPEFPETPPIGFSLNLVEGQLRGEMVWPVETIKGIAEFAKSVEAAF